MKLRDFNSCYGAACDAVYKKVGAKAEYSRKDAKRMMKYALPIMAKHFRIDEKLVNANMDDILSVTMNYAESLIKVSGFDGFLLACAFGLLEGVGQERKGFGKWIMIRSIFMGGIKSSAC